MKTIRFKQIGSYTIIDRFDELTIDTETTRLKNKSIVEAFPEKIAVNEKVNIKRGFDIKATDALQKGRTANKYIKDAETLLNIAQDQETKDKILVNIERAKTIFSEETAKRDGFLTQVKACKSELTTLNRAFDLKRRDHIRVNPIYCYPRKNEVVLPDSKFDEVKAMYDNRSNEQVSITIDMIDTVVQDAIGEQPEIKMNVPEFVTYTSIPDYRGKEIWFQDAGNWLKLDPVDIGVDISAGDIIYEDLTDTQRLEVDVKKEVYRIEAFTAEQKTAEKDQKIAGVLAQAAQMKVELEIQGSTAAKALIDSKAWYNAQVALIEVKYA